MLFFGWIRRAALLSYIRHAISVVCFRRVALLSSFYMLLLLCCLRPAAIAVLHSFYYFCHAAFDTFVVLL
jgi:hypothetical protein